MLASQVKVNVNAIMISETKLDDIFSVDQLALEAFSKPFRINRNKNGVASCSLFVKTYQQDLFFL